MFKRRLAVLVPLFSLVLMPEATLAQSTRKWGISPVAPPTTKAPVFDTTSPVYNPPSTKKAADTVVAEVDGRSITLGEVADAISSLPLGVQRTPYDELFPVVVDRLIARQALVI